MIKKTLNYTVSWLITKLKGQSYEIDKSISGMSLLLICMERLLTSIRSALKYPLTPKHRPLFLGSNSVLAHKYSIFFGKSCTVGRNVYLDGLSLKGLYFGDNVNIPDFTFIRCTGVISDLGYGMIVGNNTGFGHYNFINAQGGIRIGNDVIIGPHVKILSENHNFYDTNSLIRLQGVDRKGIIISDNVWIGAGAIILDGAVIGASSVVAAGAVVTKSFPPKVLIGGVPAKIISHL